MTTSELKEIGLSRCWFAG